MTFDTQAFMKAQFQPRTADVKVDALKDWFGDGEQCIFTVRGLSGNELARVMEAAAKTKSLDNVIQAISSNKGQIDELRQALGISDETPGDIIKRLEQLTAGSVDPKLELNVAVALAERFPIEFYTLTNTITQLTGLGMDVKK